MAHSSLISRKSQCSRTYVNQQSIDDVQREVVSYHNTFVLIVTYVSTLVAKQPLHTYIHQVDLRGTCWCFRLTTCPTTMHINENTNSHELVSALGILYLPPPHSRMTGYAVINRGEAGHAVFAACLLLCIAD